MLCTIKLDVRLRNPKI